jgi:Glycosyl hydrolases family 32 N-terminal domain
MSNSVIARSTWIVSLGLTVLIAFRVQAGEPSSGNQAPGQSGRAERAKQVVELLSPRWVFETSRSDSSTLTAQRPQAELVAPADERNSFTLKLSVNLNRFSGEATVLEIPHVLGVRLRQHDPRDRNRQNYPAYKMADGSVPVLEASLTLHSVEHPDWQTMTIGIPLAMLEKPDGEHEVVLHFSGVDWTMYVDGELVDNDFPFGYPRWTDRHLWKLDPTYVEKAQIYLPGIKPEKRQAKTPRTSAGIQYWMPRGHNNWVGDVETFFHQGRYHVFYLYDRRHHQSKFGCGAHYFEHLSTRDFRTWTEHEAATPLEEQWECIGTGVPFVVNDQLCISYGWHTTRVYPEKMTTLPAQWEYLKKNGSTGTFKRATTAGVPAGATYSVCADGVSHFRKSNIMFHPCQNPSVYTDPRGKLRMMANYGSRGIWESESVDGGWRCTNPSFPPGGDCTIFFRWGKFDYVIGGFTGLWSKRADAPDSAYEDVVRKGLDFYDGSNVPSITGIPGGRFLMASWVPIRGWGGSLVLRELVQYADGRIGSKWMKEITPQSETPVTLANRVAEPAAFPANSRSFMLTFIVHAAKTRKGRVGISFLPEQGAHSACELQIRLDDLRAQFAPGSRDQFAGPEKTLREGGAPHQVGNYAIENLIGVDRPFPVRVIVQGNEKIGGSLIDAEVASQRTLISYRPDLTVKTIVLHQEGVELKHVQLGPIR